MHAAASLAVPQAVAALAMETGHRMPVAQTGPVAGAASVEILPQLHPLTFEDYYLQLHTYTYI